MKEITSESTSIDIENMGYDSFFEAGRNELTLDRLSIARVIVEHRGSYKVRSVNGEYIAKITGKRMFNASSREDYPVVGDWVAISEADNERAIIHEILPRRTIMKRKHSDNNKAQIIATNIDIAFIVESVDRDYSLNRFERYFATAKAGGIQSTILLNKIDLISKEELNSKLTQIRDRFNDVDFIPTSLITEEGLKELKEYIEKGKTYCFLGSSGVGKSSLINTLLGKNIIKTEHIGAHAGRGKHTTTTREMYFLENGGMVIDNPGMREVGMTDTGEGIDNLFDEITALAKMCKYSDCTHINEPKCEVLSVLNSGKLDESKYANFIALKKEAEYYRMTEIEKREKDHKFGKFIKKAKKELKKYKH